MRRAVFVSAAFVTLAWIASAGAAEPLVGVWQLDHQELNGQKRETEQLTLRITTESDKFRFAFSVPINNIDFVSLSYAAKLDGSDAEIKNAHGDKVGIVQITTSSRLHYKMIMKGDKRPDTTVNLTVSADGNTLTSDSNSTQAGQAAHLVQTFTRH